ncbi:MAG: sulfatase [Acidobacteriota bacterium]
MILIDTFRPDHLGVNGYPRETAPFLEGLMRSSAVFGRAFSTSSWTAPATSSLFTGMYPMRHGVTEGFLAHRRRSANLEDLVGEKIALNRLPDEVATISELLKASGYSTFGGATNINIGTEIGFDRGFDFFTKMTETSAEELVDEISPWRQQMLSGEPYFLYLHFNDVHKPYEPRAPWFEEGSDPRATDIAAYNSEISYLDKVLGELYRDYGWDQNTLLVVVSDHGEEFGEHGQYGHLFSLYDELVRSLLVINGPGLGIPAKRIETPVSLIDVLPTVLDLVGLESPEGRDGQSLSYLLTGEPKVNGVLERRTLFAHRLQRRPAEGKENHLWMAMRFPWKLVIPPRGNPKLFNLETDPGELDDVADQHPDIAAGLTTELMKLQAQARSSGERVDVELDEATLETLRSLGYVE